MNPARTRSGFTLVELAIVLVIIGLIVGGVLVGQDLVKSATIRAVLTDVEKYNAAATTFRGKYNGLPGDLLNTKAVQFGFGNAPTLPTVTDGNRNGTAGKGDGNGVIEACAVSANGFGCETGLFWRDLSQAAFIPASYNSYSSTLTSVAGGTLSLYVPTTKLRDSALISIFNAGGKNYFALGTSSNAAVAVAGAGGAITYTASTSAASLSPLEARNIDEKLDNGAALTGTVTAVANGTDPAVMDSAQTSGANRCVLTGGAYMVDTDAHANNLACAISIRGSL